MSKSSHVLDFMIGLSEGPITFQQGIWFRQLIMEKLKLSELDADTLVKDVLKFAHLSGQVHEQHRPVPQLNAPLPIDRAIVLLCEQDKGNLLGGSKEAFSFRFMMNNRLPLPATGDPRSPEYRAKIQTAIDLGNELFEGKLSPNWVQMPLDSEPAVALAS